MLYDGVLCPCFASIGLGGRISVAGQTAQKLTNIFSCYIIAQKHTQLHIREERYLTLVVK